MTRTTRRDVTKLIEMWKLAHHDLEKFKQDTTTLSADVKAEILWHFTACDDEKVQMHNKNKGGSHAVANS